MSSAKKAAKSKLIQENEQDESPKVKKTKKRTSKNEVFEEDDISKLIGQHHANAKKKMAETNSSNQEYGNKILDLVSSHSEARIQCNENFFNEFSEIITQAEEDLNAMKENKIKLGLHAETFFKSVEQETSALEQKIEARKELQLLYKKQFEDIETDYKNLAKNVATKLENDIKKLHSKIVSETKRSNFETVRRSIFYAMQND